MAKAKAATKVQLAPFSESELEGWNRLVALGKAYVQQGDRVQFKLILLAAEVETKYGENRIGRWAEEIGIAEKTAKMYQSLARRGVDHAFIGKYGQLGYSRVKVILNYCGRASNPAAQYWLQFAMEHRDVSSDALYGRMVDVDTRNASRREEIASAYKLALAQKADAEKLKPELKATLEKFGEEYPDLQDQVLETIFLSKDGQEELAKLEELAGVKGVEFEKRQRELKALANKIKSQRRWWMENKYRYAQVVEENSSEFAYALASELDQLARVLQELIAVKPKDWHIDPKLVEVVDLAEARAKRSQK